jgi:hypothetical protein
MPTIDVAYALGDVVDVIDRDVRGEIRAITIRPDEIAYLVWGRYPPGSRLTVYCLFHSAHELAPVRRDGQEVAP